ncbi:hypothetical protein BH23GEM3_BH23GEM3_01020 [soil metagenome]
MCCDADLPTRREYGAGGAARLTAGADVLTEGYEQAVDLHRVRRRKHGIQLLEGGLIAGKFSAVFGEDTL